MGITNQQPGFPNQNGIWDPTNATGSIDPTAFIPLQPIIQPVVNHIVQTTAANFPNAMGQAASYLNEGAQSVYNTAQNVYGAMQNYLPNPSAYWSNGQAPVTPAMNEQSLILDALRTRRNFEINPIGANFVPHGPDGWSPIDLSTLRQHNFRWFDSTQQAAVTRAIQGLTPPSLINLQPAQLSNLWFQAAMESNGRPDNPAGNIFLNNINSAYQGVAANYQYQTHYADMLANRNRLVGHLQQFGAHANATRAAFDAFGDQVPDQDIRRAMWDIYGPHLAKTGMVQAPDLSGITPNTLRYAANTLHEASQIKQAYQTLGPQQITGANALYNAYCPDKGIVAWNNFEDMQRLAPSGTYQPGTPFNLWNWSTWRKPREGSMDYSRNLANANSQVQAYHLNGKPILWEANQYSYDGKTWYPRATNERLGAATNTYLEEARIHLMNGFINQQKSFFDISRGRYSNCDAADIEQLRKIKQ